MTPGLKDVLGEGFAREYEQAVARKMAERDRVSEEELDEIKNVIREAAENNAIDPEDPRFRVGRNDVLLVQAPNDIDRFTKTFENGGKSMTFSYVGNFISLVSSNQEVFEDVEPGEFYFAIGRFGERTYQGNRYLQISPCRYLLSLNDLIDEKLSADGDDEKREIDVLY